MSELPQEDIFWTLERIKSDRVKDLSGEIKNTWSLPVEYKESFWIDNNPNKNNNSPEDIKPENQTLPDNSDE